MAKPYKEGKGWCARKRYCGHDIYVSGKETKAAAEKEVRERVAAIDAGGKPQHLGPKRTTLAYALQEFGFEHLQHLKGAPQEARRINKYLEAAGVQLLVVQRSADTSTTYFDVSLKPREEMRLVPQGLGAHRKAQLCKTSGSDRIRQVLAQTPVADITRLDLQRLIDALAKDGMAPATIALERAVLRRFFNHVKEKWSWARPADNPAKGLEMPTIDNARDRVLSMHEQSLLDEKLDEAHNGVLRHVVVLLRETAMRASEPLLYATWSGVDWERNVLQLSDGKDGKRDVPLSPAALDALRALGPGEPNERIVKLTYEALKAGFRRACERAKIDDLHLHDLRHTAATRLGLETGNLFLVKALTGHKTDVMASRYVNVKAADVAEHLHRKSAKVKACATAEHSLSGALPSPLLPVSADTAKALDGQQVQEIVARAVKDAVAQALQSVSAFSLEGRAVSSNVIAQRRAA